MIKNEIIDLDFVIIFTKMKIKLFATTAVHLHFQM